METSRISQCRFDGWNRTDEGYLDAVVHPTRIGVFTYLDKSGNIVRELRPPEEVMDALSLKSLENKPHTLEHPPEMVNARNIRKYQTGHVYGQHTMAEDKTHTMAKVLVTDSDAIAAIESGKVQVSCGYNCDVIDEPGTWNGQPYDRVQKNIRYNHLASVTRGRAGEGARIRADRYDAWEVSEADEIKNDQENDHMVKIRIDGHDVEVSEAAKAAYEAEAVKAANALKAQQQRADEAEQGKAAAVAELQKKVDELQAKVDAAEKLDVKALVKARASLEREASAVVDAAKLDSMSDDEIKQAVICKKLDFQPSELVGKSNDYIDALYTQAVKQKKSVMDSYDQAVSLGAGHDWNKDSLAD